MSGDLKWNKIFGAALGTAFVILVAVTGYPILQALYESLFSYRLTAPADRDEARINAAITRAGELLGMADATLAQQPWLSGDQFAMGDIPLGALVYAWFELPIQRPSLPHLEAWYQRLQQRPAYVKAVMTPLT